MSATVIPLLSNDGICVSVYSLLVALEDKFLLLPLILSTSICHLAELLHFIQTKSGLNFNPVIA